MRFLAKHRAADIDYAAFPGDIFYCYLVGSVAQLLDLADQMASFAIKILDPGVDVASLRLSPSVEVLDTGVNMASLRSDSIRLSLFVYHLCC